MKRAMKKARHPARLRRTAYHEAGHAVIGRVLTLPCGFASIEPDYDDESLGRSICPDQWKIIREWEKRGRFRESPNAVWVARIMHSMAGAEAEIELLGKARRTIVGDGDDRLQIALMAEEMWSGADEWERKEARLRKMTRTLIRRHRDRIERVAQALLAKTTLTAEQLDKLVGKSVNDVKPNVPPELLKLYRGR